MSEPATILVVEDDRPLQDALVSTLVTAGYKVLAAADGGEALKVLADSAVDLVVSDVQMQPVDGSELLRRLRQRQSAPPVLLMTAYGAIDQAVAAMRDGAVDYLVKPFEAEELERRVARFVRPAPSVAVRLGQEPIAEDPRSRALLELAARIAQSDVTVLLTGESGTGKEVIARAASTSASQRNAGPFVAVNCAALPSSCSRASCSVTSRARSPARTRASRASSSRRTAARCSSTRSARCRLRLQAKLLRVLQEREVEPRRREQAVARRRARHRRDATATSSRRCSDGAVPRGPLLPAQRGPARAAAAARAAGRRRRCSRATSSRARAAGANRSRFPTPRSRALASYAWPGNVRELENAMQRALLLCDAAGVIEPRHLVLDERARVAGNGATSLGAVGTLATDAAATPAGFGATPGGLADGLWEEETRRIVTALASSRGREQAAELLGISGRTLRYKLQKMRKAGIHVPGDRV